MSQVCDLSRNVARRRVCGVRLSARKDLVLLAVLALPLSASAAAPATAATSSPRGVAIITAGGATRSCSFGAADAAADVEHQDGEEEDKEDDEARMDCLADMVPLPSVAVVAVVDTVVRSASTMMTVFVFFMMKVIVFFIMVVRGCLLMSRSHMVRFVSTTMTVIVFFMMVVRGCLLVSRSHMVLIGIMLIVVLASMMAGLAVL